MLPRRRPQVPTILFTFCDEPNHIKAEFLRGKTVLIDFIDVDDTPELRETVRRWMLEIPKSLPAAVVVSVMFKNKQLIAWKFDYESKNTSVSPELDDYWGDPTGGAEIETSLADYESRAYKSPEFFINKDVLEFKTISELFGSEEDSCVQVHASLHTDQ